MPEQAEHELERDPDGIFEILQARAYVDVHRQFERAEKVEQQPQGGLADLWRRITYELHMERNQNG